MKQAKTRLIFHLYCKDAKSIDPDTETYMNGIHRKILTKFRDKFDYATFCVVMDDTGDGETLNAAVKWITSCGFCDGLEIKVKQNTYFRDAQTFFDEIVDKLDDIQEIVMFAHNKGGSLKDNEVSDKYLRWTTNSYFSLFRKFEENVDRCCQTALEQCYVPVYGAKEPWDFSVYSKYAWHTPGTILMFNPRRVAKYLEMYKIEKPKLVDYLSAEMFFGNIIDVKAHQVYYGIFFEGKEQYLQAESYNAYNVDHRKVIEMFLKEDEVQEYEDFYNEITGQ